MNIFQLYGREENMKMEPSTCYICHDRRRIADTDTSKTKIAKRPEAETLKETLIRALSLGYVEDNPNEQEQTKFGSSVCVVSLSSRYDGGLEAVSEKVVSDHVVICRRCETLLRDFEYHERTSAKIAEDIRRFLTRQEVNENGESNRNQVAGHEPQTSLGKSVTKKFDERKSIRAALRALKKSDVTEPKKRGEKRKKELIPSTTRNEDEDGDDEVTEDLEKALAKEVEDEKRLHNLVTSRTSKRIQRRREDGLVIRWGDAMYETENSSIEDDVDLENISEDSNEIWPKEESPPRKRKGRKPIQHRLIRLPKPLRDGVGRVLQDQQGLKYQCPFCHRYYIPSNSQVHNCTSYKNQLRCQLCNIFFTSYIRLEKHLEVIHLKQKQLQCSEEDCKFMCVSEPAFLLHKHLHFLAGRKNNGNEKIKLLSDNTIESDTENPNVTHTRDTGAGEVTVIDDVQGIVTSPDIADQVSFLLDEKSFLSNGQPVNITTAKKVTKDMENHRRVLHLASGKGEKERIGESRMKFSQLEDETKIKSYVVHKSSRKGFQCPFCDTRFETQRLFDDHVRDIHKLTVKSRSDIVTQIYSNKADAGGNTVKENIKCSEISEEGRDNLVLKKNFNMTPEDLTCTVERLKGKISKS